MLLSCAYLSVRLFVDLSFFFLNQTKLSQEKKNNYSLSLFS